MATRNLIVCLDGTWNEDASSEHTNVRKIYDVCNTKNQKPHYEEGVGTSFGEEFSGGVWAYNIDEQILGAYRFLVSRFSDTGWNKQDNKVFIFGFSRGAYAARLLAGLIDYCGVPAAQDDASKAWECFFKSDEKEARALNDEGRTFAIKIEMLGVWDTVQSSLYPDLNERKLPACVVKGYHAMAIDEKRKFFPVLKWDADPRVTQTWFSGVHCDIGGGNEKCGLSNITLLWMIDHAKNNHGLAFKDGVIDAIRIDPSCEIEESYVGKWKAFGENVREISIGENVDQTVMMRREAQIGYNPVNLPESPRYVA